MILTNYIDIDLTGITTGTKSVSLDEVYDKVNITGVTTLTGDLNFAPTGTPVKGMKIVFDYGATITLAGHHVFIMSEQVKDIYADKEYTCEAEYDGSNWIVKVTPDFDQTDIITNTHLADDSVDTDEIVDEAVTKDKLSDLSEGSILIGDGSDRPVELTAGTTGQIVISDGTTIAYKSISGAITLDKDGVTAFASVPSVTLQGAFDNGNKITIANTSPYRTVWISQTDTVNNYPALTVDNITQGSNIAVNMNGNAGSGVDYAGIYVGIKKTSSNGNLYGVRMDDISSVITGGTFTGVDISNMSGIFGVFTGYSVVGVISTLTGSSQVTGLYSNIGRINAFDTPGATQNGCAVTVGTFTGDDAGSFVNGYYASVTVDSSANTVCGQNINLNGIANSGATTAVDIQSSSLQITNSSVLLGLSMAYQNVTVDNSSAIYGIGILNGDFSEANFSYGIRITSGFQYGITYTPLSFNTANDLFGLTIGITNTGVGNCYAFKLTGNEADYSGSHYTPSNCDGKIRIQIDGQTLYIPAYASIS